MPIPKEKDKQVKMIFDKLGDKNLPRRLFEAIAGWFVSEDSKDEKDKQFAELFDKEVSVSKKPSKDAYKSYRNFARKHGLRTENKELQLTRPVRVPLRRRLALQVAAVLALVIGISGSVFLLFERAEYTGNSERNALLTVSVPADDFTGQDGKTAAISEPKSVTLPDNSTVVVGKGSEIRYADGFGGERRVELRGEARFNVTKAADEGDSFTVHTEHFRVKVLGTQFKVHSPAGESHSTIDLYHGSVEVEACGKKVMMKPTDRLRFDHDTKRTSITHIPLKEITYDGMPGLVFDNAPISEVLRVLENGYGVRFKIEGDISQDQTLVEGDFTPVRSLGEFMSAFAKLSGCFTYEIADDEIRIKIDNI